MISDKGSITTASKPKQTKYIRLNMIKYAAAAIIIGLVGYFSLFTDSNLETHQTLMAQTKTVNLPDGSFAYLNADTRISFDAKAFVTNRNLNLEGEAFFEVEKGSKFKVTTSNGDVRVLGTSFNVRSRKKYIEVKCFSGEVGVSFDKFKNEKVLIKGDMIVSKNDIVSESHMEVSMTSKPEWREGKSSFVNSDFTEVIDELERQFDIEITMESPLDSIGFYTGGFPHDNLDEALSIISASINQSYKIEEKAVTFFKNK